MKRIKWTSLGIFVLAGILCFSSIQCKKNVLQANVIIDNQCGVRVDVFLDGVYKFSLDYQANNEIENVELGTHVFTAQVAGTQNVVATITFNVSAYNDFLWAIETSASIVISNLYGESLSIYADGGYVGELADQQTETMPKVPFGDHQLEAQKSSDGTTVATLLISVNENKEYNWNITNNSPR